MSQIFNKLPVNFQVINNLFYIVTLYNDHRLSFDQVYNNDMFVIYKIQ